MLKSPTCRSPLRWFWALVASVAAGYLWAVAFGDGVRGLETAPAVDNASTFPDANVAVIAALCLYPFACFFVVRFSGNVVVEKLLVRWLVATAVAGGVMFALSRLFI